MNFKKLLKKFNLKNLDKALNKMEKIFTAFSNGLNSFNKGMDDMMDQLSSDFKKSDRRKKSRAIKDRENLDKIFGSKSNVKIWSDKKSKESLF